MIPELERDVVKNNTKVLVMIHYKTGDGIQDICSAEWDYLFMIEQPCIQA